MDLPKFKFHQLRPFLKSFGFLASPYLDLQCFAERSFHYSLSLVNKPPITIISHNSTLTGYNSADNCYLAYD